MKILMVFDQIQSGHGGKERSDLPLGGEKIPIGSASMFTPHLKGVQGNIVACLYCGDEFFRINEDKVIAKILELVDKIKPDIVICGPAYNYIGYGRMCGILAKSINEKTNIPAIAAMAKENEETIENYKHFVDIVKMPKKGGTGLTQSLRNICLLAKMKVAGENITEFKQEVCY